jgi:large subunit ribosomal protein L28
MFKKRLTNAIVYAMTRNCSFCGKGTVISRNRSHAQNRTPRTYKANIQKISIKTTDGTIKGDFCTKCIKRLKMEIATA